MSTARDAIAAPCARRALPGSPGAGERGDGRRSRTGAARRLRPGLLAALALALLAAAWAPPPATSAAREQPAGDVWASGPVVKTRFTLVPRRPAAPAASGAASLRHLARALARCRASLPARERERIAAAVAREADRHGYDRLFVQALVEVESTCSPVARSARGAVGLTQVRPLTARAVALANGMPWRGESMLLDPDDNLRIGLAYLNELETRFGDLRLAVAAYNLGPTRVAAMPAHAARRTAYVRRVLDRHRELVAASTSPLS